MYQSINFKKQAAIKAVEYVRSGMILGLGTGSTTLYALEAIGKKIRDGEFTRIVGIPSSNRTADDARRLGIPLGTLDDSPEIDLTIDGADEVDSDLNLIKGAGGALLREKIIAQNSRRVMIVVDESKTTGVLGTKREIPVEVIPFGSLSIVHFLEELGSTTELRKTPLGLPFITDEGNYIIDCRFNPVHDPLTLAERMKSITGIVEHGLFLNIATDVIVSGPDGMHHLVPRNKSDNTS